MFAKCNTTDYFNKGTEIVIVDYDFYFDTMKMDSLGLSYLLHTQFIRNKNLKAY